MSAAGSSRHGQGSRLEHNAAADGPADTSPVGSAQSQADALFEADHPEQSGPDPPVSWRDPRVGHAHHSRLERTIEAIGMGRYQLHLLLLTGTGWAADNAWMTAIPMVLPAVQAHFNVSDRYSGALSSACFLGMMIGSLAWGSYSDTYGRLPSFTYTLAITTLFAIILPFSPSFSFLCFSLFLLGSGLGGSMPTDGTIFLENTPKSKQYLTVALSTFFSAGAALSSAWAIIVMPCRASPGDDAEDACKGSWRWRIYLAGLAVLTALFFLSRIFLFTLHESPRYLVSQGRTAEARRVLQHIVEYNDTTEREALESIARSADPGASALRVDEPVPSGIFSRLIYSTWAFVTGRTSGTTRLPHIPLTADAESGKDAESSEASSSESQDGDLEAGARKGAQRDRPRHLDRGMSVRLSDVRSWSSGARPSKTRRKQTTVHHQGIPTSWRETEVDAERIAEQEAEADIGAAFGTIKGGTLPDGTQSEWASVGSGLGQATQFRDEPNAGEREGLLTSRISTDHGRIYHDDSLPIEESLGSNGEGGHPGMHSRQTSHASSMNQSIAARNSSKQGTIQSRVDALLSPEWRRTTLLTWGIWTTLNLGYTMLNVFLPKILEERAGGRNPELKPPSTQSQSSDAEALWSYFAYALASIPGPLIAAYLVELHWLGRKGTLALSLGCTSVLMLLLSSVLSDPRSAAGAGTGAGGPIGGGGGGFGTTAVLVLISFGATTAYAALYGYTPELFAIELRGTACGVASAAGRLAGVMAPMIGGWLLGRTGDASGPHAGRSSGPGGLCGLSAGLLALTVLLTLLLPREEPRDEQGRRESEAEAA